MLNPVVFFSTLLGCAALAGTNAGTVIGFGTTHQNEQPAPEPRYGDADKVELLQAEVVMRAPQSTREVGHHRFSDHLDEMREFLCAPFSGVCAAEDLLITTPKVKVPVATEPNLNSDNLALPSFCFLRVLFDALLGLIVIIHGLGSLHQSAAAEEPNYANDTLCHKTLLGEEGGDADIMGQTLGQPSNCGTDASDHNLCYDKSLRLAAHTDGTNINNLMIAWDCFQ